MITGFSGCAASILLLATVGAVVPVNAQNLEPIQTIVAQSPTPVTTMKQKNHDEFFAEIKEGEFSFVGVLKRTSGNTFIGEDNQVHVMYDLGTSRVTMINKKTGTEFYNYTFSTANEGSL